MVAIDKFIAIHLPYNVNINRLISLLRGFGGVVFLDSGLQQSTQTQYSQGYSYISAAPLASFNYFSNDNYLPDEILTAQEYTDSMTVLLSSFENSSLPDGVWPGGLAGYVSYDFGESLHKWNEKKQGEQTPLTAIHIYDWAITFDHEKKECWFATTTLDEKILSSPFIQSKQTSNKEQILDLILQQASSLCDDDHNTTNYDNDKKKEETNFFLSSRFSSSITKQQYKNSFAKIQHYLHAGDCYQINLTQQFSAHFEGECWKAFNSLSQQCQAPYSAYFETAQGTLLSFSPEQFIQVNGTKAQTKPVKGTRPRSRHPDTDQRAQLQLRASEKDQAENLMIVDLLRNDFGKVCKPGSVKVNKLFEIESFHNVHHLVSTIQGELNAVEDTLKLFFACFPGGSITGAPKKRAMEIINELETHNRDVYCGSFLIAHPSFGLKSNILIRTFYCDNAGTITTWAGGGIVADSDADAEYQECFDKIETFINILEEQFLK